MKNSSLRTPRHSRNQTGHSPRALSNKLCAFLVLTWLALLPGERARGQAAQFLYSTNGATTWRDNYTGDEGCQFMVGSSNVIVNYLGYFSTNVVEGLYNDHEVGIYTADAVDPELLASNTVPAGALSYYTNGFYWVQLSSPLLLAANTAYVCAAAQFNGDGDDWYDAFGGVSNDVFNTYFVGANAVDSKCIYSPSSAGWPMPSYSSFGSYNTYGLEGVAFIQMGPAGANVLQTNVAIAATETVVVNGCGAGQAPFTNTWWLAGTPNTAVFTTTNPYADLVISNATAANSGTYFLTSSNALGGGQSANVTVTVTAYPVGIPSSGEPTNFNAFNNYPVSISCTPTGTPPISFQWYLNGAAIASATNSTYSFFASTNISGESFACTVSNMIGATSYSVNSSTGVLTVLPNLAYPQEYLHGYENTRTGNNYSGQQGGIFTVGSNSVLVTHLGYWANPDAIAYSGSTSNCNLATNHHVGIYYLPPGVAANSYLGLSNLLGYVNIPAGTNPVLNGYMWLPLNPPLMLNAKSNYVLEAETSGDYWGDTYAIPDLNSYFASSCSAVYGGNGWGATPYLGGEYTSQMYSAPNMAILTNLPAVVISNSAPTAPSGLAYVSSVTNVAGSSLSMVGFTEGPAPLYYAQWYLNGTPLANATNTTLTLASLQSSNAGSYYLVVSNYQTSVTLTSPATALTVITAPLILGQFPVTYTNIFSTNLVKVYAGASPTFSVSVEGVLPLHYQWFANGAAVSGATNFSYRLANAQTGGLTNFYCLITNSFGNATSAVWVVASIVSAPTNSVGGLAPYPQTTLGLSPIGYWRLNEPDDGLGDGNPGAIAYDYAGGNDGIYTNTILGQGGYNPTSDPSDSAPEFASVSTTDSDVNSIAGINFGSPAGTSKAFTVEAWVIASEPEPSGAGIVTLGWGNGGEQFNLDTGASSSDFRFFIRDAAGNTHLVNSTVNPYSTGWTHLVGVVDEISNQLVTFYINGQSVGTAVVTNGSGILASSLPMSIGARMSGEYTDLNAQFSGYINDVAIFNYALSSNQVLNQYIVGGTVAPYFNPAPPASVTAVDGLPLSIPATAYGTPGMGYTWMDPNGNVMAQGTVNNSGSLNVGFATNSTPASWNGQNLTLMVTNAYGSLQASVAVTVTLSPVITTNLPPLVNIAQGQSYTYSIGAVGVAPLAYQWYEGSTAIPGATGTTYSPASSTASTNNFYVVVTNSYGSVTSSNSTFIVVPPPATALASTILGFNPIGYWPMHEMEAPAPGDIETNYGSLGNLANAYYPDWADDSATNAFQRDFNTGAGGAPSSSGLYFAINASNGGTATNALYVPHVSPVSTLQPPFSVECWYYRNQGTANSGNQGDVWSQNGYEGLNAGSIGAGSGSVCGIRLYDGGAGFQVYTYNNTNTLNGPLSMPAGSILPYQWYHVVVTCDARTNITIFTNGVAFGGSSSNSVAYGGLYSPDYWTPFEIGSGRGDTRALSERVINNLAVYTNALSAATIMSHYQNGANGNQSSYFNLLTTSGAPNNPSIYLLMNAPNYTSPPSSTWPTLYNYGSVGGNGLYTPGTMPGALPGPSSNYTANAVNVAYLSGVSSFADAGYNAAWDPSGAHGNGSNAFSVVAMFRGNPADNRFQDLVGHSDSSWRMTLGANAAGGGAAGSVQFTYGSTVSSSINCNDGNWHQAIGVYQPGPTAGLATLSLYVDGQLNATNTAGTSNGITAGSALHVMLGAAPDYTNQDIVNVGSPYSLGRQFAGQLCDVAIFTNALNAAQVRALYVAAGGSNTTLTINQYLPQTLSYVGSTNLMTLYAGANPSFTISVAGAPVYYQWYTNGVGVGFGTNPILTLPNVQSSFTAQCIATNNYHSVTSVVWSATVLTDPDPAGSFSQLIMSDQPMAYWRLNEAHGSPIAFDYAGGANGLYGASTTNGQPGVPLRGANTELSVAMCPTTTISEGAGTVTNSGIILNTNMITFVCWVLPTTNKGPNPAGLFENRSSTPSCGFQLNEAQVNSYVDYNWAGSSAAYSYGDPYYIPENQWGMAVCEITPQNAQFYVYYGTNGLAGIATNNFNSQTFSFYGVNYIGADPNGGITRILYGNMNELAIFNYQLSLAQLNALYQAATNGAVTPFFTTQPQNTSVQVTGKTNLTVAASSFAPPITYQWYYNSTASYAGATALANGTQANGSWMTNVATAQLTISNAIFGAAGYYFAAAGNSAGNADSAIAQLSVTPFTSRTNITSSVVGGNLVLTWPANWTGWRLQSNSVSLTQPNEWFSVPGSGSTNQMVIPINPANGSVFYRLVYP